MSFETVPGVYQVMRPSDGAVSCPLVLDSPHSGTLLPNDFHYVCDINALRSSEDTLVDRLIATAPTCGATILTAEFTRSYIDLNRSLDDLDPSLCAEALPWHLHPTKRTQFGLGLIHAMARGQAIYDAPLSKAAIENRIATYYTPYQACLQQELAALQQQFGQVLHLNIHAMPSMNNDGKLLPDIVIGDLDGTSAHRVWRDTVRDLFKAAGFVVTINTPYKGVEIIKRTGKPRQGFQALQIEINKALYLDEQTLLPNAHYPDCVEVMQSIWQTLSGILLDVSHRHAAE